MQSMATPAAKHRVVFASLLAWKAAQGGWGGWWMARACCPGGTHSSTPKAQKHSRCVEPREANLSRWKRAVCK